MPGSAGQRATEKWKNEQIVNEIKEIHKHSRQSYGSPRIYRDLKEKGVVCSENKTARLMQMNGVAAKRKSTFMLTTDSRHSLPVAENKLNQEF